MIPYLNTRFTQLIGHSDEEDPLDVDSDTEMYQIEFLQHKRDYYMNKLEYENVDAYVFNAHRSESFFVLSTIGNFIFNFQRGSPFSGGSIRDSDPVELALLLQRLLQLVLVLSASLRPVHLRHKGL